MSEGCWTRGTLRTAYGPNTMYPWYQPGGRELQRGRSGAWPGYGPHPISAGYQELRLDRGPLGLVDPGFGYAKDPSDPRTWRNRPIVFT